METYHLKQFKPACGLKTKITTRTNTAWSLTFAINTSSISLTLFNQSQKSTITWNIAMLLLCSFRTSGADSHVGMNTWRTRDRTGSSDWLRRSTVGVAMELWSHRTMQWSFNINTQCKRNHLKRPENILKIIKSTWYLTFQTISSKPEAYTTHIRSYLITTGQSDVHT